MRDKCNKTMQKSFLKLIHLLILKQVQKLQIMLRKHLKLSLNVIKFISFLNNLEIYSIKKTMNEELIVSNPD